MIDKHTPVYIIFKRYMDQPWNDHVCGVYINKKNADEYLSRLSMDSEDKDWFCTMEINHLADYKELNHDNV